jgi:hypothetical protein
MNGPGEGHDRSVPAGGAAEERRPGAGEVVVGGCLGGFVGVVIAVLGGIGLLGSLDSSSKNCGAAYGQAAIFAAIVIACAVVAWFTLVRRNRTPSHVIAGSFALGMMVFVLIPFPCNYSFMVLLNLSSCTGSH